MRPNGIHHVSINVDDVPAAIAFYTDVLGFVTRSDRPDFGFEGAWLDVGSQQVHLLKAAVPSPNGQHYAIWVDDIETTVKEVRDKGVDVSDPMRVGRGLQAFLSDPAGNSIELHQTPA